MKENKKHASSISGSVIIEYTTVLNVAERDSEGDSTMGYVTVIRVLEGHATVNVNSDTFELNSGETAIFNPYDLGRFKFYKDSVIQQFIFDSEKHFEETGIPAMAEFNNFLGNDAEITHICENINREYENQEIFHENMLNALVSELIINLCRRYTRTGDVSLPGVLPRKQKIVREAIAYIHENCHKGISTKDISAHICVSTPYLCRCFKEIKNVTVLDYCDSLRCRKAYDDLTSGTYTVSDVCEKYGFNSLSYFNRRYKKFRGCNPGKTLSDVKARYEKA